MASLLVLLAKIAAIGSGWRTYIAAAILATTGVLQVLNALQDLGKGGISAAWPELQTALVTLGQALAAFGLRAAVTKVAVATTGKAV